MFGKPSLLNIYMFLSDHIYDSNPIVSQLTQKLHLSQRGNRQVWLEERSEISILGRAPCRVFAIQAVSRLHCQHHPQEGCIIQMLNTNYPTKDQVKLNNGKGVMLNIEQIRDDILSLRFPGAPVVALPHLVLHQIVCAVTAMPGCEVKNCLGVDLKAVGFAS